MNAHPPLRIVDCTLREGEQYAHAHFDTDQRLSLARALDHFGVDVLEVTSPAASKRAFEDARALSSLGLNCDVAVHIRCHPGDARAALECGAQAVHVAFGTSPQLRQHSHRRSLDAVLAAAEEVLPPLLEAGRTVRFSCEDAFRTPLPDLVRVAQAVEQLGVQRFGLADTVGAASPDEVRERVGLVRQVVECDLEFHGHNDGGCAVANLWAAYRSGVSFLDVTVLGIGERNGICPLSGLVARALLEDPVTLERFELPELPELDAMVAGWLGIEIPFNACITSPTAFAHKAGLHTNAVLNEPGTYESIDPGRFGFERQLLAGHALVGRNLLRSEAARLGLQLGEAELVRATAELKERASTRPLTPAEVDELLRRHHSLTPQS